MIANKVASEVQNVYSTRWPFAALRRQHVTSVGLEFQLAWHGVAPRVQGLRLLANCACVSCTSHWAMFIGLSACFVATSLL